MPLSSSYSRASAPGARIVDFQTAELRQQPDDTLHLQVAGAQPTGDVEVRLAPRSYSDLPDYWAIEVVALQSKAQGDSEIFVCTIPLTDIIGSRGITVVGANRVQRIDVSPNGARKNAAV
nr:hypothetical protein [uncultured Sphingorhabdus sp.]